jgi:hypothetical protein
MSSFFHPSIVFPLLPSGSHFMNYYMNVPQAENWWKEGGRIVRPSKQQMGEK